MNEISKCVVCDDNDREIIRNPIFTCEDCHIGVHKCCYGILVKPGNCDPWWCSPCSEGRMGVVCVLCMQGGGALKKTTCDQYVHVICALFTEGITFTNKNRMEPIRLLKALAKNHGKICVYCSRDNGTCCKCTATDCNNFLHVTCGQKNRALNEKTNPKNRKICFEAFCHQHKPGGSTRRLSSIFVTETLSEKEDELNRSDDLDSIDDGMADRNDFVINGGAEAAHSHKTEELSIDSTLTTEMNDSSTLLSSPENMELPNNQTKNLDPIASTSNTNTVGRFVMPLSSIDESEAVTAIGRNQIRTHKDGQNSDDSESGNVSGKNTINSCHSSFFRFSIMCSSIVIQNKIQ